MRSTIGLGCCLAAVALVSARWNAPSHAAAERLLADYQNDDGSRPDGQASTRDDSSALQKALDGGPGMVRLGPGTFRIREVTIPDDVTLVGAGAATILQASGGRPVFLQQNRHAWRLRDVTIQGEAAGDWRQRTDQGLHGMVLEGCWGYEVSGVAFQSFNGAGLQIGRTNNQAAGFSDGGVLTRLTARENFIGIRFDTRAEYVTASHLHCLHNVTGLLMHAGNSNISSSNIGENIDGLVLADHENGSHGSVTNCLINHNQRHALWASNVENGMAISNCCFFYGTIRLENCRGMNITSGLISASIATAGPEFNRISGNHIIPLSFTFQFAPATLLEGNFTKDGPWKP